MQRLNEESSDLARLQRPPEFHFALAMESMQTIESVHVLHLAKTVFPRVLLSSSLSCYLYQSCTHGKYENTHFAPTGFRPRGGVAASYLPVVF